jgi:hypothetical protein
MMPGWRDWRDRQPVTTRWTWAACLTLRPARDSATGLRGVTGEMVNPRRRDAAFPARLARYAGAAGEALPAPLSGWQGRPRAGDGAERSGVPAPARERSGRAGGSRRCWLQVGVILFRPLVPRSVAQRSGHERPAARLTQGPAARRRASPRRRDSRGADRAAARRCISGVTHTDAGTRRPGGAYAA